MSKESIKRALLMSIKNLPERENFSFLTPPKKKRTSTPEGLVLHCIEQYLCILNQQNKIRTFWRNNVIPPPAIKDGKWCPRKMPKYSPIGMSDLTIILNDGQHIYLEIKADKGKQSESQQYFEQQIKGCGVKYVVARSVEDVQKAGIK